VTLIESIVKIFDIVFPIHPRTVDRLRAYDLYGRLDACSGVKLTAPMDYFAFQKLIASAACILTDSGGIQEESTFRQVPCLTLRPNTERPSTVTIGTNELVPFDIALIIEKIESIRAANWKTGAAPPLWDGKATDRIVEIIAGL
jgi:UDP-N-acetylglucosamine 2-epimerase (non-hydrolysing)